MLKMNYDDSLNDSDEVFSLYSSENVTETFRAQLKKIVANNKHLTNTSQINNEEARSEKEANINEEIPVVIEVQEVDSAQKTTKEKIGSVSPNKLSGVNKEYSLEDSIEVIEEFTPKSTRQSERLRQKRGGSVFRCRESSSVNSDVAIIRQVTCRRRQRSKKKKKKQKKGEPVDEITLDDSPQPPEIDDELNPEVSVKVIWKSVNVKKFMLRKFQKLSYIYELLSKEENVAKDKIILTFNSIRVSQNDTPDSLNLQVYHFLDGGVLNESTNLCSMSNSNSLESDGKSVTLKFQDINKKIITLNLNKNDKLKVGMIMYSEQLEIPLHKIRFFFDGELIQPTETPESLGLEGGEVIDIKIID